MTEKDFIAMWIERIRIELKKFPDYFLKRDDSFTVITLPTKLLIFPPPLFNTYQIIDEAGDTIYSTDDQYKAKYILYANRARPAEIKIPSNDIRVYEVVRDYEKHLDSFLKEMEIDFKRRWPNSKGFNRISLHVFNSLELIRH